MGEVRLWPLDSVAALREAVLRLCFDDSAATDAGTILRPGWQGTCHIQWMMDGEKHESNRNYAKNARSGGEAFQNVGFGNTNYDTFGGSHGEFGIQKLENPHRAKSRKKSSMIC